MKHTERDADGLDRRRGGADETSRGSADRQTTGGDPGQAEEGLRVAAAAKEVQMDVERAAREETDNDTDQVRRRSGALRRRGLAAGLAAGSVGLLAGGGAAPTAGPAPVMPERPPKPAAPEVAKEKAITWDLTVTDHERVDFFVEFLMGKNYDRTRLWLERIGKYGPLIQSELRAQGMPEDLLYLTMIESGFDPNAYSTAHAAGLWQFIAETGERYGLEVSEYVDQRRDPIESTRAALTYLQEMHERFDSWYLAAAGYNTGENRVGRLMRETTGSERGEDAAYWDIWDRLPRETRDYVPLMLAAGHIAKQPGKYGFHDVEPMEPLEFEALTVPGGTKLSDVAKAGGVSPDAVADLNPHFLKGMTPPGRAMTVRVPLGRALVVAANLDKAVPLPGKTYLAD
jgi:membrane-bound lytic murein transglycosylase D